MYWLEAWLAPLLSVLFVCLNPTMLSPILFLIGVLAWTFAEYVGHRFVLHGLNTKVNRLHHKKPWFRIEELSWPVWLLFGLTLPCPAITAGLLFGYGYYLVTHHCLHHDREWLSPRLLLHHDDHHRFASKNFGVSSIFWDSLLRTRHVS